jgi:hypothetical protein
MSSLLNNDLGGFMWGTTIARNLSLMGGVKREKGKTLC